MPETDAVPGAVKAATIKITSPQKCPNGHVGWGGFRIVSPNSGMTLHPVLTHIALNDAKPPEVWTMRIRYRSTWQQIRVICEHEDCGAEFEIELPELI
jgi:hypothetical protein